MTGLIVKWVAIALAALVLGVLAIVVFTDVWAQVGLIAAIVVVCIPLLVYAWYVDRKEKARRQDLEEI